MQEYINKNLPKAQREGQIGYNKQNQKMQIISYRNAKDIDIQFEDGAITTHRAYSNFLKGAISYPRDSRIGEVGKNNSGDTMIIIAYRSYEDIDIQFEDGTIVYNKRYGHFKQGRIAYPIIYSEINGEITKVCKVCKQEKVLSDFITDDKCVDGYRNQCRDCIYENNRHYIDTHKQEVSEYKREYNKRNPHKQFNANARRRELEENQGNGITLEQWLEMMNFFEWKCAYSGISLTKDNRTIDHIMALNKGGEHEIWNCVPMFNSYNYSKHNYDMLEWYRKQDFYSEERVQKIYECIEYAKDKWNSQ